MGPDLPPAAFSEVEVDIGIRSNPRHLTLGHSPDPDDAFMFFGLAAERIDTKGWTFEHILQDIQTLNERATRCELDITAVSIHSYPYVAPYYALTNCGASMGDGYGPMVVAREPLSVSKLAGKSIAIPGERTTAFLVLNLLLGRGSFRHAVVAFDRIPSFVAAGNADAGLVIHEGQLTYDREHLHQVIDLGSWWKERTGLPLPLGGNAIRRSLGSESMVEVAGILKESIAYSLEHRDEAIAHAMRFGRGLDRKLTDRFVGMYVNDWTLDYGQIGRQAIGELLRRAHDAGLIPPPTTLDFVG